MNKKTQISIYRENGEPFRQEELNKLSSELSVLTGKLILILSNSDSDREELIFTVGNGEDS